MVWWLYDLFIKLWQNWNIYFRYGQMTAGSYCYIGPQGIVHGTTVKIKIQLKICLNINLFYMQIKFIWYNLIKGFYISWFYLSKVFIKFYDLILGTK